VEAILRNYSCTRTIFSGQGTQGGLVPALTREDKQDPTN